MHKRSSNILYETVNEGLWGTGSQGPQTCNSVNFSLSLSLSRSLSLPLYIKSHWSLTKERLQIRSTKTPLWGASERINEHWYTFAHSVLLPWPQLHCRETTQGEKDAARSEKKLKQCKNRDEDERSVFPLYPPPPSIWSTGYHCWELLQEVPWTSTSMGASLPPPCEGWEHRWPTLVADLKDGTVSAQAVRWQRQARAQHRHTQTHKRCLTDTTCCPGSPQQTSCSAVQTFQHSNQNDQSLLTHDDQWRLIIWKNKTRLIWSITDRRDSEGSSSSKLIWT